MKVNVTQSNLVKHRHITVKHNPDTFDPNQVESVIDRVSDIRFLLTNKNQLRYPADLNVTFVRPHPVADEFVVTYQVDDEPNVQNRLDAIDLSLADPDWDHEIESDKETATPSQPDYLPSKSGARVTRDFPMAYVPTGHQLKLSELGDHEFFGEDFRNHKCSVAVFRTDSGKYRAVWSYGDWQTYGVGFGERVWFRHTQTMKRTDMVLVGFCLWGALIGEGLDAIPANAKLVQWTLK